MEKVILSKLFKFIPNMEKFNRANQTERIKLCSINNKENMIRKHENLIKEKQLQIISRKIKCKNNYNIFKLFLISFINVYSLFFKINKSILVKISEVKLKIIGTGNIKILSDSFFNCYNKCEIYINDSLQNISSNEYYFNSSENLHEIKIIWKNTIRSANSMFAKCNNITEIDFSNFNSSLVTSMKKMFYDCISLTSLNLSSFNIL